jgi:hypothetical protein
MNDTAAGYTGALASLDQGIEAFLAAISEAWLNHVEWLGTYGLGERFIFIVSGPGRAWTLCVPRPCFMRVCPCPLTAAQRVTESAWLLGLSIRELGCPFDMHHRNGNGCST